ncbi:MAG: response regulator [Actinobacteria bacterium]|nr:response regulator [Actinomycetota bacterium]
MLNILLVDDSVTDAKLIKRFAQLAQIANPIVHVESGPQALSYLETEPLPGLVLLDINMPVMNGHEVLQAIRGSENPSIARLPVVFLTTSDDPEEVARAYSEAVNSYVVKPVDAAGFQTILRSLTDYWFQIVRIPSSNE